MTESLSTICSIPFLNGDTNKTTMSKKQKPLNTKSNKNIGLASITAQDNFDPHTLIAPHSAPIYTSSTYVYDSADKAPEFLRTNQQFNGGGGFGYKVGEPVGLISVRLPMPGPQAVLNETLPQQAWGWLLLAAGAGVGLLVLGALGVWSALRSGRAA